MANEKGSIKFDATMTQRILYIIVPVVFMFIIVLLGPYMKGPVGTVLFIVLGLLLGLVTFFVSGGWGYKLEVTDREVKILDKRVAVNVPLDKIGLVVRNGGIPFPTVWILVKNAEIGNELPKKGIDPKAKELIDSWLKRNPGKTLKYVPVPGGHIRSVSEFAGELKRRIPPLTLDERLGGK
jgi:hypothetical protein